MSHPIYAALPEPRRPITSVDPTTTIDQCVSLMVKNAIGAVVVLEDNELVGIVSERDIVRSCLNTGMDIKKTTAADIAYKNVTVLNLFDPVDKAMEVITQTKRQHLLVAEHGKLLTVLSIGDLLYHLLDDKARVIEHLESYIHT